MTKLDRVLKHFGGYTALGRALGISRQAVHQWNGVIPRLQAFEIERITKGKFKVSYLSPKK